MAILRRAPASVLVVAASAACLAWVAMQTADGDGAALEGDPAKFDRGFYEKIQDIVSSGQDEEPRQNLRSFPDTDLEYAVPVTPPARYYHTVIAVAGNDQEAIDRNKASLVDLLSGMGARNIYPGSVLSFVTAEVPVAQMPLLSIHGAVARLGDGELSAIPQMAKARQNIQATPADLAGLHTATVNGSGVTVAIVDYGINSIHVNDRVTHRNYCSDCQFVNGYFVGTLTAPSGFHSSILGDINSTRFSHGTDLAHVIAASGLSDYDGIAPGVWLLDAHTIASGGLIKALDWSLAQGADVANIAISIDTLGCGDLGVTTHDMAVNEAVNRGVVVVISAGNYGNAIIDGSFVSRYSSVTTPACAHNAIAVGGVAYSYNPAVLYVGSSKGPYNDTHPRLVPHIAAPAGKIYLFPNKTAAHSTSGTSSASATVSAAAALALQVKPDLTPTETKALLFLGADWTGPAPCTSRQYEQRNPSDRCSHAARAPASATKPLNLLNHAGFGTLDVAESVRYAANYSSHVRSHTIDPATSPLTYGLNVTGSGGPVKVLLSWPVSPMAAGEIADLDLIVSCPGSGDIINASSSYQTTEFAVFEPEDGGICAVRVSGGGVNGTSKEFTLASTRSLLRDPPSSLAVRDITVSSASADGTYYQDDPVRLTLAFPRAVTVSDTSPPYLLMDTGGRASYTGIDAANRVLSFEYRVGRGHSSADLDYNGTDALVLPGSGSLTDAHTGVPVAPVLPAPGEPGSVSHSRDIVVNGTRPPAVSSARVVAADLIEVTFTEPVSANRTDGTGWTLSGHDATSPRRIAVSNNTDPAGSSASMNLGLSGHLPDTEPDLRLAYAPPSAGGKITDADGNGLLAADIEVGDGIGPAVSSITRHHPAGQTTNQQELTFRVTFGEPVTGVDIHDFAVAGGSGTVTGTARQSDSSYLVNATAQTDGAISLEVSASHDIADASGNTLSRAVPDGGPDGYLVDTSPPFIASVARHDPDRQDTNDRTPTFNVTFSEPVLNVGRPDFETSGAASGTVSGVSGSGSSYLVTVSAGSGGALGLDVSSSHDIADAAGNRLDDAGSVPFPDQTYAVDLEAPSVEVVTRHDPDRQTTNQRTLTFRVAFSEPVANVGASDFTLSRGQGTVAAASPSGASSYLVGVDVAAGGVFDLDVSPSHDIADAAGNRLSNRDPPSSASDQTYAVDLVAPSVSSITRHDPAGQTTDRQTLTFRVSFSEPVAGVDASDFALSPDSTGAGSVLSHAAVSGGVHHVTVEAPSNGTYNLDVSSFHGIADPAGNPLSGTAPSGRDDTYTVAIPPVDNTPPQVVQVIRHDPDRQTTNQRTLTFRVAFSEPVANVGASDFTLSRGQGTVAAASPSGASSYLVGVDVAAGGVFDLDVSPSHDIADAAGNRLSNRDPPSSASDQTYAVDLVAPSVSSITRHDPAGQTTDRQTLTFRVSFSEPVAGVDASDFLLASGSGTIPRTAPSSDSAHLVTVSVLSDGAFDLDVSPSNDIADAAGNLLGSIRPPAGSEQTYLVDTTAPPPPPPPPPAIPPAIPPALPFIPLPPPAGPPPDTTPPHLVSITGADPPGEWTGRRTLVYNVTFSEPVTGVNLADFALSPDSGPGPLVRARSPALDVPDLQTIADTVTVDRRGAVASVVAGLEITHISTTDLTVQLAAPDGTVRTLHNGTFEFGGGVFGTRQPDFNGTEAAGNWTLTVRDAYAGLTGTLNSWNLTINYSPDPGRLLLESAPALETSGPGAVRDTITVGRPGIAEAVAVGVNVTHASAGDLAVELVRPDGRPLALHGRAGSPAGTYMPDIAGADILGDWTLRVLDGAGGGNASLNSWSLAINYSSAGVVTALNGSEATYLVAVLAAQDGAYNLDVIPDSGIADAAGNPLNGTSPAAGPDHTYAVDTAPPAVSSITGADPPAGTDDRRTIAFNVTFSEAVTGVAPDYFALSPGSTGEGTVGNLTGYGPSYLVTVSVIREGTFNLDVLPDGGISDAAGNRLADAEPTSGADHTHTVGAGP